LGRFALNAADSGLTFDHSDVEFQAIFAAHLRRAELDPTVRF
jgi:hypothetical protein